MSGYTVIDFETTGLFPKKHDRVVEIGVVHLSDTGEVEDEWSTLVNPQRDVGPTNIHGITAREVRHAPTFAQLAPYILQAVVGRGLVAHNARFDLGFLAAELELAGFELARTPLPGVCTMRLSGRFLPTASRRLLDCSDAAGLEIAEVHEALSDAEAAAGLLRRYLQQTAPPLPWSADLAACTAYPWPAWPEDLPPITMVPRSAEAPKRPAAWLDRIVAGMPRHEDPNVDSYLEVLESALLDRYLAEYEEDALVDTATDLGLDRGVLNEVHHDYLRSMARVALADGVVTEQERADLDRAATLLGLATDDVDAALALAPSRPVNAAFDLQPGDRICLTGEMARPRHEWESAATAKGLIAGGLTKATRVLIAADPDSASGKAEKARKYGIPIITEAAFGRLLEAVPTARPASVGRGDRSMEP